MKKANIQYTDTTNQGEMGRKGREREGRKEREAGSFNTSKMKCVKRRLYKRTVDHGVPCPLAL
jgi:hypothetical protein